jgi:hypothetical protein
MLRLAPLLLALACSPRHGVVAAPAAAVLPLVHTDVDADRWYTLLTLPDGTERAWFVDTGYGRTTCDDDLIAALEIRAHGRVRVRGEGGRIHAQRARLPPFSIAGHRVDRLRCVVRDLPSTSSIEAPHAGHVAGVLGSDLLRQFHVVIDPGTATLQLHHPDLPLDPEAPGTVALRREQGWSPRLELRVDIDAHRAAMVLDTGATRTFLDGRRLGLEPVATKNFRLAGTGGTGGRTLSVYRVDLGIGLLRHDQLVVFGRPRGARTRGLLGLDVLRSVRIELDPRRRLARLVEVPSVDLPVWAP